MHCRRLRKIGRFGYDSWFGHPTQGPTWIFVLRLGRLVFGLAHSGVRSRVDTSNPDWLIVTQSRRGSPRWPVARGRPAPASSGDGSVTTADDCCAQYILIVRHIHITEEEQIRRFGRNIVEERRPTLGA